LPWLDVAASPLHSLRAVLWVWYRGTNFRGWQRQVQGPTVQETIEEELRTAGFTARLAAAGRTDRGVHARQQVASLRLPPRTDLTALAGQLQGSDWGCVAAAPARHTFHAQWTPSSKEYRYRLAFGPPPPSWAAYAWDVDRDPRLGGAAVDPSELCEALSMAVGTRDFCAFHAASSVRRPRTLSRVELQRSSGGPLDVRLVGDGFGRYQVRALVGGAARVASGHLSWEAWRRALEAAVPFEGMLAPAHGLTLWAVQYGDLAPFDEPPERRLPAGPPFELPA
jgi:tRNA pseudouridine38-40 synthase